MQDIACGGEIPRGERPMYPSIPASCLWCIGHISRCLLRRGTSARVIWIINRKPLRVFLWRVFVGFE